MIAVERSMTARQAAALLRMLIPIRERAARIRTRHMAGELPSIAELRSGFGLTTRGAQHWRQQLARERRAEGRFE